MSYLKQKYIYRERERQLVNTQQNIEDCLANTAKFVYIKHEKKKL